MTIQSFRFEMLQDQGRLGQAFGKLVETKDVVQAIQRSGVGWDPWPE